MRITGLRINNVLGVRTIDRKFSKPVVLFAGRNYSGKSSLQAAIRMALLGEPERVHLKKDYAQLVTDGAKEGEVVVTLDSGLVHLPLPDGRATPWTTRPEHLEYCLAPERFPRLTDDERRTFLFRLTGLKTDGQAVMKRMLDRGCEAGYVEQIGEALKGGFEPAHRHACERARDAKGAWRGATGETWGKDKAEAWQPQGVVFGTTESEILARVQRDLQEATEAEREAGNALASLTARAEALQPDIGADPEKAARIGAIQATLAEKSRERDEWQQKVAQLQAIVEGPNGLACPHCGGMVVQDGFQLKPYEGSDPAAKDEARGKLARAQDSLKVMRSTVSNLTRELDEARGHAAKLEAAKAVKDKAPTPHEIEAAREAYQLAQDKTRSHREEEARLSEASRMAQSTATAKAKADRHHHEVLAWLKVADALAPDGIPGELLAGALAPINKKLAESALMTGWRQVAIAHDMAITCDGRGYHLLSESERWRAEAMIAYAIASHGPKFLLLDRVDVLDINARGEALAWIVALVHQHKLDGAILCATLKTAPAIDGVEAYWLESGQVLDLKAAA